jgi:hypothetical protein
LLLLLSSIFSIGQDRQYLQLIKDTADKLVISFWGQDNFAKYIKLDKKKSKYFGRETNMRASFDKDINFNPNSFRFHYDVIHPAFRGDTAQIDFTLDSTGKLQIFYQPEGLYQPGDLNKLRTISKLQAIEKAKSFGLTKGKTKWTLSLEWIETDPATLDLKPNSSLQDFIKGNYCWAVKSTLSKVYRDGCFVYTYRVFYIDIISGALVNKKDM